MKFLVYILCFLTGSNTLCSQAYDGVADTKLLVGFSKIGSLSGVELQLDKGLSDLFSYGAGVIYIFNYKDPTDEYVSFIDKTDLYGFLRLHGSLVLNVPKTLDPYAGFEFGLRSIGVHSGIKYQFSEYIGIYGQYTHSLSDSFYADNEEFINLFNEPRIATGLSIYF